MKGENPMASINPSKNPVVLRGGLLMEFRRWVAFGSMLIVFAAAPAALAGIALSAEGGSSRREGNYHWDYAFAGYYKLDSQTLFGVRWGQSGSYMPLSGTAYIRLPLGRIVLPVVSGDLGMTLSPDNTFYWQAGGGLDWKNGKRTSILLFGGYQKLGSVSGIFGRLGYLLEF